MSSPLLSINEAAEYLSCSSRLVQQLKANGLPFVQLTGKTVRFRVEDLDEYVAAKVQKNTPLPTPMDKLGDSRVQGL